MRNRLSPARLRTRSPLLGIEGLEDRVVPAAILNITNAPTGIFPQFDLVDPNPDFGGLFGTQTLLLSTGNIVVTDPGDDAGGADAGAVYLFNGTTGALISTITGSHVNDHVGINGVKALINGNYAFVSIEWDNGTVANAGAVTWGSGTSGVSGVVSVANSLVGSQTDDVVGDVGGGGSGLTVLANGNYVVRSRFWSNGAISNVGAVTWGNGTTGISGPVTALNSLVGSTKGDQLGDTGVKVLPNGNYVVSSPQWDNGSVVDAGAVTWADGSTGISGPVTSTNSLIGSTSGDRVGLNNNNDGLAGVKVLTR